MKSRRSALITVVALLVAVALRGSGIAAEVGTIAGADGSAFIYRGDKAIEAVIGNAVGLGDQLATGRPGRLRIVFQDDSVLTVGDDSRVTVDENLFDPNRGTARSVFGLLRGKVNAVVSEYNGRPGSGYEIKSETAVAGVRGTEFAMIFDPDTKSTEVIGITGVVQVHSIGDTEGAGVLIKASESTQIGEGKSPSTPQRLDERLFRDRTKGFDFVGRGGAESQINARALTQGNNLSQLGGGGEHVAPGPGNEGPATRNTGAAGDATGKLGQPPSAVIRSGKLGISF